MRSIDINVFKWITALSVITMLLGIYVFVDYTLNITYITLIAVVCSFYLRRDDWREKSKHNLAINTALGLLVYVGIVSTVNSGDYHNTKLNTLFFASILVAIGFAYERFQKGNMRVNSHEIQKIPYWDVFTDYHEEKVISMNGNIAGDSVRINLAASNVSYDEAIALMRKLIADGKEPHATSSKQYDKHTPQMDHNGMYIGDRYSSSVIDEPFYWKEKKAKSKKADS